MTFHLPPHSIEAGHTSSSVAFWGALAPVFCRCLALGVCGLCDTLFPLNRRFCNLNIFTYSGDWFFFFKGPFFLGAEQKTKYLIIRLVNKSRRISLGMNLHIATVTGKMVVFKGNLYSWLEQNELGSEVFCICAWHHRSSKVNNAEGSSSSKIFSSNTHTEIQILTNRSQSLLLNSFGKGKEVWMLLCIFNYLFNYEFGIR